MFVLRLFLFVLVVYTFSACSVQYGQTTICNPMELDYAYIPAAHKFEPSHRSTADPVVVPYKGKYYLFSTNQEGYWISENLRDWEFIKKDFYVNVNGDNVCAPGVAVYNDTMILLPSITERDRSPLYASVKPERGEWFELTRRFTVPAWDPQFFQDDDGRLYLYWGSSNVFPIRGVEISPKRNFEPKGLAVDLITLNPYEHGWERFGENNTDTTIAGYFEGPWMTKYQGKYYLQYAAPGTEWNVYADGVYVSDSPLGPFAYQAYNPFSYKPGGYITGAGHGSTFQDEYGNYWHAATGLAWIKYKFERRVVMFPAGFDNRDQLYTYTAFGDYPMRLPRGKRDPFRNSFAGWMLLSYRKYATASSSLPGRTPEMAADENIRTYWSANSNQPGEWLQIDLGGEREVRAVQVNYADEKVTVYGKQRDGFYHQYRVLHSPDGQRWQTVIDKSKSTSDEPHDYTEIRPLRTRYLRLENVRMPAGNFAISDFRVFGNARGERPAPVQNFQANRNPADPREVRFTWDAVSGAYGYNIYFGVRPDALYNCIAVYGTTEYFMRGLDRSTQYHFSIEALGETGISERRGFIPGLK